MAETNLKREIFNPEDPKRSYELLQDNISRALSGVTTDQNRTEILEDLDLETDFVNLVEHKLGKKISNYDMVSLNKPATIHWDKDSSADLSLYLPLISNMNCVVSLLIW